ncbi:MAG: glycosyltransferase family 4 protein [Candidatus Omnitrophota bacterium]
MKVLLITTHIDFGGISSYTFSLAKALINNGHEVVCASSQGEMHSIFQKNGIRMITIPVNTKSELNPKVMMSLIRLLVLNRKEKFDVIHAQTRVTQVLAWYMSKLTKIPFLSTCHGFFRHNIGRQFFPCWGEFVIAISEAVKKHLMIDFYVPEKKVKLVHNGIDIDKFKILSKRLDLNYKCRTVGIIARLSTVKGHKYLIEAMAQVIREFGDARLFIFGQGKIKYELVNQAERLKISSKVFFLPSISNTAEVLQEIDIFVMPSVQEGLGLSILEALACGIPVVASNVGGIPSIIKHDVSGLLVEPGNPMALAGAIMHLMEDRSLAIRLGKKGRQEVEERFNLGKMAADMEKLYEEAIKKK